MDVGVHVFTKPTISGMGLAQRGGHLALGKARCHLFYLALDNVTQDGIFRIYIFIF